MSDPGTRYADSTFGEIVDRLKRVYESASKEIAERLDEHQRRFNAQDKRKRLQVESGKLSKRAYEQWVSGHVFRGKLWEQKAESVTTTLLTANQQAVRIIDGKRRAVFGENASYQAYRLEHDANMDLGFTVYDSAAVTKLLRDQPALLPVKDVKPDKDTAWNRKTMSSVIAREIITGAPIEDIAATLAKELGRKNDAAMTRWARTAMTGAQNAGRMEVLHEAQEMGIRVRKGWLATLDHRTRPTHQHLDGQFQDVDKPFDSDLGPIMYPGDPAADEANTWNCRCTLIYDYIEYPKEEARRYDQEAGVEIGDMTYDEWKEWAAE